MGNMMGKAVSSKCHAEHSGAKALEREELKVKAACARGWGILANDNSNSAFTYLVLYGLNSTVIRLERAQTLHSNADLQ